jgi:TetR/AcrR family transcriptional regulator, cholesterol catabolism regulator
MLPQVEKVSRLERSQHARRERIIEAVLQLAREGGYDAVQVRAVSDLSLVGSETIYRYYGSRDRMISAAVRHWLEHEFWEPAANWLRGDTPAERLLAINLEYARKLAGSLNMLETYTRATVAEGNAEDGLARATLRYAMPLLHAALDGVPVDYRDDAIMILFRVSDSALAAAGRGAIDVDEVESILERTVHRLAQHPAMQQSRPAGWAYSPD